MKKWYATINGNDDPITKIIKIGVIKNNNGKFEVIASNNDDLGIAEQNSMDDALGAIRLSWGQWKTFSWID